MQWFKHRIGNCMELPILQERKASSARMYSRNSQKKCIKMALRAWETSIFLGSNLWTPHSAPGIWTKICWHYPWLGSLPISFDLKQALQKLELPNTSITSVLKPSDNQTGFAGQFPLYIDVPIKTQKPPFLGDFHGFPIAIFDYRRKTKELWNPPRLPGNKRATASAVARACAAVRGFAVTSLPGQGPLVPKIAG